MESKFCFVFLLIFCTGVQSDGIFDNSYEYLMDFGKSLAPNALSMVECVGKEEGWGCAREKAGKMLDVFAEEVENERKNWEAEADAEIRTSGRSMEEMPSKVGREITESLNSLTTTLGHGIARAFERKKHDDGGGIDSITISTGGQKKQKKKKQKPAKIHLIQVPMRNAQKEPKGRNFGSGVQSWVIGERSLPVNTTPTVSEGGSNPVERPRGMMADMWSMGQNALDSLAEHVVQNENLENGIEDRSSVEEQRGKKKKKKKAILKLLILGAVIKAKIATLLQILTYKLQVKFFIVALLSLAVNIARLWIDIKNKHNTQPQKDMRRNMVLTHRQAVNEESEHKKSLNPKNIIYYEHAQHQHHYDHEEEEPHGWGPWSRSIFPDEEIDVDASETSPYHAQERQPIIYNRPYTSRT